MLSYITRCSKVTNRLLNLRRHMFIQVEETPNPNSLKFLPGETVLESGTVDFQDKLQASMKSPLAKALFRIKGVKSVFYSQDFITVSKEDDEKIEWNVLKPLISSEIMRFYTMKEPISYSPQEETAWVKFKKDYLRTYASPAEEAYRKNIFVHNKRFIDNHTSTCVINKFCDWTREEMSKFRYKSRIPCDWQDES